MSNDDFSMEDFDFKPITSGLGFHHNKSNEVRPVFTEKTLPTPVPTPMSAPIAQPTRQQQPNKEMAVYQNDLSMFYNNASAQPAPVMQSAREEKIEKVYDLATRPQRVIAYLLDLSLIAGVLGIVLTVMARTISMDLLEVWSAFPNEITPLVLVLFAGFYLIYFSIFEKSPGSTLGKNLMNIKVVNRQDEVQSFNVLFGRSVITLLNFLSLGLFSWFDLQNKVTNTKVIRIK
jgi:uncharacterized RDD family membrane protein YckC